MALNLAPFSRWSLHDKAAQRQLTHSLGTKNSEEPKIVRNQ